MSTTLALLARVFPQVRKMHRDTIRIKSEREEWRQRYTSLKARSEMEVVPARAGVAGLPNSTDLFLSDIPADPRFEQAYANAHDTVHAAGSWEWRARIAVWAAEQACAYPGDFVVCERRLSVPTIAVLEYLDGEAAGKDFYFCQLSSYGDEADAATPEILARYPRSRLVFGDSDSGVPALPSPSISALFLEVASPEHEIELGEALWPRLIPGGVVLLADYHAPQSGYRKPAWDRFARDRGLPILALPTGQGLLLKP